MKMRDDPSQSEEGDSNVEEFANAWADYYVGQGPRPESAGLGKPGANPVGRGTPERETPGSDRPSEH
jgi:hypothetical protein